MHKTIVFWLCVLVMLVLPLNTHGQLRSRVIVTLDHKVGNSDIEYIRSIGGRVLSTLDLTDSLVVEVPSTSAAGITNNPRVVNVEADVRIKAHDAELDNTWGVKLINAGIVHDGGNTGIGVNICLLDTGIDTSHPELYQNYKGGQDFVNGDLDPFDDNGHGTHVAGTIAAIMNALNVRGAAPRANLYVYKILDASGSGYASAIVSALQACVKVGGKVSNSSFGANVDLGSTVHAAYDNAYSSGVVNVASAGNNGAGTDTVGYPGQYSSVIAVAATDSSNVVAGFSSTGPAVDISAPGVNILSTYPGNNYAYLSGTSMAAPHITGVAALVISCGITTPSDVRNRIMTTALDLGITGIDSQYGAGLVQADKAAMNCPSSPPPPPPPTSYPISLKVVLNKLKAGKRTVVLNWTGATTTVVTVIRTIVSPSTFNVQNTGSYTDNLPGKGGSGIGYQICQPNSTVCSNVVIAQ